MSEDFAQQYLGEFATMEMPLADRLAIYYHLRCEAFDRAVCNIAALMVTRSLYLRGRGAPSRETQERYGSNLRRRSLPCHPAPCG